jgi:hypothetical protein
MVSEGAYATEWKKNWVRCGGVPSSFQTLLRVPAPTPPASLSDGVPAFLLRVPAPAPSAPLWDSLCYCPVVDLPGAAPIRFHHYHCLGLHGRFRTAADCWGRIWTAGGGFDSVSDCMEKCMSVSPLFILPSHSLVTPPSHGRGRH